MKQMITVKGQAPVVLFSKLLAAEQMTDIGVESGGAGVGRSYLGDDAVVCVVADAQSCDPMVYRWVLRSNESWLVDKAPPDQWKLLFLVPELEVLFFQRPEFVRQLVGHELTAAQLEQARTQPRQVLQELFNQPSCYLYDLELARRLETVDVTPLRSLPEWQEVVHFFRSIPDALRQHLRLPPYDKPPFPERRPKPDWV
jgi:hypothetical protein